MADQIVEAGKNIIPQGRSVLVPLKRYLAMLLAFRKQSQAEDKDEPRRR